MNLISKKLHELEKNIVSDTPKTKTVLYIDDATEWEIHRKAMELLQRQHNIAVQLHETLKENPKVEVNIHALDFSPDEKAIVDKSNALYHYRIMELFDNGIAQFIHLNDAVNKWIIYSRFNWFLSEMREWFFLRWQEEQVYEDPEYFNLCAGEQERRREPFYGRWRKWLNEESWNRYYEEHEKRRVADSIKEPSPRELEEDHRQVEQDNAEEEAKDAKFLKEKCPDCTEKCKWFFEQIGEKKE